MKRRSFLAAALAAGTMMAAGPVLADKSNPDKLRVALLPDENASTLIQNAQPLKTYLQETLGKEIEIIVTTDYSSMIEAMRFGRIEIGYFGPFSYVLATTQAPVEAFAVTVIAKTMQPSYRSIIIAREDSPVKSFETIKGNTFAFVDPGSTSGYMVPAAAFKKAGLTPEKDFKQVMYSGGHDATIVAVGEGKVNAGAVADRIYERGCAKGLADCSKIKVVWQSEQIWNDPVLYRKTLPEDMKKKIREAFYSVKNLPFGEMGTVARFDPIADKDYDALRDIAKTLDLDLTKMK